MNTFLDPFHCVSNNLHQTARAATRIYGEELRKTGIQRSQFSILAYLSHLGSARVSDLADMMFLERTTMTRNLNPLQKSGLIIISQDPDDARARRVMLTESGVVKFREALPCWKRAQKRIVDEFGEGNWQVLEASLRDLRKLSTDIR